MDLTFPPCLWWPNFRHVGGRVGAIGLGAIGRNDETVGQVWLNRIDNTIGDVWLNRNDETVGEVWLDLARLEFPERWPTYGSEARYAINPKKNWEMGARGCP